MTVPISVQAIDESENAVKLARYAQIIEFPECALFGVRYSGDDLSACQHIWSHRERVTMAHYLGEAQIEIEQVTGYPLSPKWFVSEQARYQWQGIRTKWTKVLASGIRAITDISIGESVDHTSDPAIVGPIAATVTDKSEIKVYHPGTDAEIEPSGITIAGGNVTIEIPRCRLVLASLEDTPSDGLDYADDANFEDEVDVKRVYTDTSDQGSLVYPHGKGCACAVNCTEDADAACVYVRDGELGFVDVRRSSVASQCTCGARLNYARINYCAGLTELTSQAEDAIIRLAHVKMPSPPCGCQTVMDMWTRDRHMPDVLTSERENCKFGMADGSWIAYQFASAMATRRMSVL